MPARRNLKMAAAVVSVAAVSFLAGYLYRQPEPTGGLVTSNSKVARYRCPMHPQYVSDRPGEAPCCGMRLEPIPEGRNADQGHPPGAVHVPTDRQQLAGVRTDRVEFYALSGRLSLAGRVVPDERRLYPVITKVEGVVREVYPPTTGALVRRGEPLAAVYSRDLLIAQQGYIYALNAVDKVQADGGAAGPAEQLKLSAADSLHVLQNLEFSPRQIQEMERTRRPFQLVEVVSPTDGFIVARNVFPNQRFGLNTELFRVADLSHVWVLADVFEKDREFARPRAAATVRYQGRSFPARIADVSPQFDPESRTLKARLELDNPGHILRPDMFVDVDLHVKLPAGITAPADAVVDSGARKTVFVDLGNGYFEPRLIETGWRFGDRVQVTHGLQAGERIVVAGNFLLDSESRMKTAAAGIQAPAKDPVCGMDVDPVKAKAAGRSSQYQGTTYYFCADQCKRKFDADPAQYAGGTSGQSKQAQGPAIDPVCGMEVDRAEAKAGGRTSQHGGTTYYFCSDHCKRQFDKEPAKYLKKPSGAGEAHI